jgi:hypothetical protein
MIVCGDDNSAMPLQRAGKLSLRAAREAGADAGLSRWVRYFLQFHIQFESSSSSWPRWCRSHSWSR